MFLFPTKKLGILGAWRYRFDGFEVIDELLPDQLVKQSDQNQRPQERINMYLVLFCTSKTGHFSDFKVFLEVRVKPRPVVPILMADSDSTRQNTQEYICLVPRSRYFFLLLWLCNLLQVLLNFTLTYTKDLYNFSNFYYLYCEKFPVCQE